MKIFYYLLATLFFTPYALAFATAHIFKIDGHENMPTIKEWFLQINENEMEY